MLNLSLDIGNTWIKGAFFDAKDNIVHTFRAKNFNDDFRKEVSNPQKPIQTAIVSNVRNIEIEKAGIKANTVLEMNHKLHYPFSNQYASPNTLGMDRVCAISGAMQAFPNTPILVITAGTCITYNFMTEDNLFLGGGISPGLSMRYKALNNFTGKLPLIKHQPFESLIGTDTQESIWSGVQQGLLAEVKGVISEYKALYETIQIIMTGGATVFFENKLKNEIFADQNLIFKGLNAILKLNVK